MNLHFPITHSEVVLELRTMGDLRWCKFKFRESDISNYTGFYVKDMSSRFDQVFCFLAEDNEAYRQQSFFKVFFKAGQSKGTLFLPFALFETCEWRGMQFQRQPLDLRRMVEIGLLAAKPHIVGDFSLKLCEIGVYK